MVWSLICQKVSISFLHASTHRFSKARSKTMIPLCTQCKYQHRLEFQQFLSKGDKKYWEEQRKHEGCIYRTYLCFFILSASRNMLTKPKPSLSLVLLSSANLSTPSLADEVILRCESAACWYLLIISLVLYSKKVSSRLPMMFSTWTPSL
jgi:hypothetical protein